ncbi:MAG: ABC transporter permease [Clostridia bacterium]|nr:ABC transporter permease [Clostridia bacterium]
MYKYVIKRILLLIPVLLGVVFIVFFIMNLTPGDPGRLILGESAKQEDVDRLNDRLGFNKPYFVRFFNYIKDIVTKFDFGLSYATQKPVVDQILIKFPYTLKMAIASVFLSTIFGVTLGVTAAVKQYTAIDSSITVLAMVFTVMPAYWTGMLMILLFSIKLGWLPASGASSLKHYILPVLTIAITAMGSMMRLTRSVMLEAIRQDYVRTARAKGAPERRVVYGHALKNALLPLITSVGSMFGGMMGGAVLSETVFNIPGIGSYIVSSIRSKDIPAVMTCTLFFATLFSLIMLCVDLLYAFVDPRIKAKYVNS